MPINVLDRALCVLFETLRVSMTVFTKAVRSCGICLKNCVEYGSPHALHAALLANGKLILPLRKAKKYKYAKRCLIMLAAH